MFQLSVMPRLLRRFSCFSLLAFLHLVVLTFIVLFARNVYSAEVTLAGKTLTVRGSEIRKRRTLFWPSGLPLTLV